MISAASRAEQALRYGFHSLDLARSVFPMLTTWGVEDFIFGCVDGTRKLLQVVA